MSTLFASISASATSVTTTMAGRKSILIRNRGTADVYWVAFTMLEEPRAATTADSKLASTDQPVALNESLGFRAISVITASSTATVEVTEL